MSGARSAATRTRVPRRLAAEVCVIGAATPSTSLKGHQQGSLASDERIAAIRRTLFSAEELSAE
jgi:hypothetical protein